MSTTRNTRGGDGSDDANYLKSDEIGLVIAKGMATLYQQQPANPVDYLGKWLLNVAQVQRAAVSQMEAQQAVQNNRNEHERHLAAVEKERQAQETLEQNHRDSIEKFNLDVSSAHDLTDELQNLTDHLKAETKSTAVYIGKLVTPHKFIKENDNDKAHIDRDAEKIIRFCNSDSEHQYIVDKTLTPNEGLTFDVFKDAEPSEAKEAVEPELDEEGNPIVQVEEPKEVFPISVNVKEVVREPRINFFKVPRLGSYMAIRLEYNTCLYEEAFDAGVTEMIAVNEKKKHQQEEIAAYEQAQKEAKEQAEADGEPFTPETKEWPAIEANPFLTRKVQFVVCVNTLGQDREFTEEERIYALRTVQKYRDQWEETECKNLAADIQKKLQQIELDKVYKELHEPQDQAEMELRAESNNQPKEGEPHTDEQRVFGLKKARFDIMTKCFCDPEGILAHNKQLERDKARAQAESSRVQTPEDSTAPPVEVKYHPCCPEQFKNDVIGLRDFNVIKFPRVFQNLFYILGYTREQICERETNALNFKEAKKLINQELFTKINEYQPCGQRTGEFTLYQKMAFLKKNIADLDEEAVENYSITVAKLLKWVNTALDIRCDDVVTRRDNIEILKQERQAAVEAEAVRQQKYNTTLEDAKAAFEEKVDAEMAKAEEEAAPEEEGDEPAPVKERPTMDLEEFQTEFEANNPIIEIPPEVVDDIDNDYDLPYTPPVHEKDA